MNRERKMLTVVSLFVAVLILFNVGIEGYNNGYVTNDNIEWDCGGSCHTAPSVATVTMSASTLTPFLGQTVYVNVTVAGAEASASPLGIMIIRSLTTTNSQPSVDGWVILDNPAGTGAFNYYQEDSVTGGGTWQWTLQAPMAGGTYHLYAREHHGDPSGNNRFFSQDIVGLTFAITAPDYPPSLYITAPGSAPGEQYLQGTIVPIDWAASDDNPWPAGGNVVNLTYGPTSTGGTPVTNLENVGAGTFSWDTTGVAPGVYYINGSVYDSVNQLMFDSSNNSFEIILPSDSPPTFYVTGPGSAPGEQYVQGTMVPITWTAADDNPWPFTGLIVNITYGPTPAGGTPIANNQDVVTIFSWDTIGVAPGNYYINASVWDSSGQTTFANCNNSFEIVLVDRSPVLYVTNPGSTPGESYGQGSLITVSWAASDESPWPAGGNVVNITYGPTPAGGTPIANDQDVTVGFPWDTTGVPMGFYFVNISVYDSSSNITFANSNNSFEITAPDTSPPIILNALATPSPQELGLTTNISASITDDTSLNPATVFVNVTYPSLTTVNISMARSVDLFWVDQPFMEIGMYNFIIWAADTSGNWASDGGAFEVIDTTPPGFIGTTALPSPQISGGLVNISSEITDRDGVTTADVEVFDPFGTPMFNASMLFDMGTGRYYWETTYVVLGTYTFNVWASDSSGNWGTDSGNFQIIGFVPPSISGVLAQPSPQERGGAVNISAIVTDDIAVSGVWVEVMRPDMTIVGNFTLIYDSISSRYYNESTYIDLGLHTFTIWALDNDAYFNSTTGTFDIVDTTPPMIEHLPVTKSDIGVAIPIYANITDAGPISSVTLYYMNVGDTVYQNVPMILGVGDEYSASVQPQAQVGDVRYYIEAVDDNSNSASHPTTGYHTILIVDNVPPTISNLTANPPTVETGEDTTISAEVTDDTGVSEVHIFVSGPDDTGGALEAVFNTVTGKYEANYSPPLPGSYTYTIWAMDGSSNWGQNEGTFNATTPVGKTPNPPEDVRTMSVEGRYILVSWVAPDQYEDGSPLDRDDILGYYVHKSESSDGPYITVTTQPVRGQLYLDGDVSTGATYYYKISTVMIDNTASSLSDFAEGELEEDEAARGAGDILPWILVAVFLVLWILTLIALMMGRKREAPSEPPVEPVAPQVEEEPAIMEQEMGPLMEEVPFEEAEMEEELIEESEG